MGAFWAQVGSAGLQALIYLAIIVAGVFAGKALRMNKDHKTVQK